MKKLVFGILIAFMSVSAFAQNATVTGVITDGESQDYLIGATIMLKGTTKGTIADVNGRYTLSVPAGERTVDCVFIGYKTQSFQLNLKAGEVKVLNIVMNVDADMLKGSVVSAQAMGQQAAINDQLRSTSIINAVSAEKLSELPDVNVADAIGRLPGLMIQRDGGEGQKVIIRGLDPKYNTVAINGMNAPATGENDRSTDLNMISPEMIAGAEVMKANTADKDADGLGGTVNLIMKDAPHGLRLSVNGETGYHSQIQGLGRLKFGVNASNRFFHDKLGMIFGATIDRTDRSNDTFSADYEVVGNTPTPGYDYVRPRTTDIGIQSNTEIRTRSNVNLNFDIDLGNGNKIKMSNILSNLDRDREVRRKRYSLDKNKMRFTQTDIQSTTTNLSNVLQGDFNIGSSTLNTGLGHSAAWMKTPWNHIMHFYQDEPYNVPTSKLEYIAPYDAISSEYVSEKDITQYYLYNSEVFKANTYERELSAWADWKTPFNITEQITGYVKFGGKYRQKDRTFETENYNSRFDLIGQYLPAYKNMPDLEKPAGNGGEGFAITNFLDNTFKKKGEFLGGYYPNGSFDFALDPDKMSAFYNGQGNMYKRRWYDMVERDYVGHEEMYAAYIMSEINFGELVTFIPGFRYDYSRLRYTAYSGTDVTDAETYEVPFEVIENTDNEQFGYLLPQIHLRIKPTEWMDVRLAYTKTLSRPDFKYLSPRTIIRPTTSSINWSRTNLKPILSTNYDATVSFYPNNWGLFTVSAFYKDIENFIYERKAILIKDTDTDPGNFDLHTDYAGYTITYPLNSPTKAMIMGLELDAQVNFNQLQNKYLKGIVLSANLSLMDSGMDYHTSNLTREKVNGKLTTVYKDVIYRDRLISQPSFLVNVSLGYDYKKFSARLSCNYQDGVLITPQQRSDGADKEITSPFLKIDSQVKYKINKKLALYMNFSNINFARDEKIRYITGYPESVEYYGATAYIGIKYDILK